MSRKFYSLGSIRLGTNEHNAHTILRLILFVIERVLKEIHTHGPALFWPNSLLSRQIAQAELYLLHREKKRLYESRKIRLIEGNARFLRRKSDLEKDLCDIWLSVFVLGWVINLVGF